MSNHFRKMGRRMMRKHKALPSKRKRHGIPFKTWVQLILKSIEGQRKKMMEAEASKPRPSIAEQLKAEEKK